MNNYKSYMAFRRSIKRKETLYRDFYLFDHEFGPIDKGRTGSPDDFNERVVNVREKLSQADVVLAVYLKKFAIDRSITPTELAKRTGYQQSSYMYVFYKKLGYKTFYEMIASVCDMKEQNR